MDCGLQLWLWSPGMMMPARQVLRQRRRRYAVLPARHTSLIAVAFGAVGRRVAPDLSCQGTSTGPDRYTVGELRCKTAC